MQTGFHHIKLHSLYLSTVQRNYLVTLLQKLLTQHLIVINLYGYAAGGETYPVYFYKKTRLLNLSAVCESVCAHTPADKRC